MNTTISLEQQNARILVTGGTGFIGQALCRQLAEAGHQLTLLTRDTRKADTLFEQPLHYIDRLDNLQQPHDIIINLAGAPISVRWTRKALAEITESRYQTTQQLIDYIARIEEKPRVLLSASAIGYYGNSETTVFDENTPPADNSFPHQLCEQWEQIALQAEAHGVRVCLPRIGLVLEKDGGVVQRLLLPFRFFMGGKIGHGRQFMSWIHRDDLLASFAHALNHEEFSGPFNATAPEPVSNARFTQAFATALGRPAFMTVPGFNLKLLFGEMAQKLLLEGQNVVPEKLLASGFEFAHPQIETAFQEIFSR